jgi:hypothetical protein
MQRKYEQTLDFAVRYSWIGKEQREATKGYKVCSSLVARGEYRRGESMLAEQKRAMSEFQMTVRFRNCCFPQHGTHFYASRLVGGFADLLFSKRGVTSLKGSP